MTRKDTISDTAAGDLSSEIAATCLGVRVRRLNRVVSALYEDALRPHGLTLAQLNMLVVVAQAQNRSADGTIAPSAIGRWLAMERSTVSRNLTRMLKAGWVRGEGAGPSDRLAKIALTDDGARLLQTVMPAWRRAQAEAETLLGPATAAALHRLTPTA
jgi:DNA-binding MarR family transcriptional regulator